MPNLQELREQYAHAIGHNRRARLAEQIEALERELNYAVAEEFAMLLIEHGDNIEAHEAAVSEAHAQQRPLTELREVYMGDGVYLPLTSHTHNLPDGIEP